MDYSSLAIYNGHSTHFISLGGPWNWKNPRTGTKWSARNQIAGLSQACLNCIGTPDQVQVFSNWREEGVFTPSNKTTLTIDLYLAVSGYCQNRYPAGRKKEIKYGIIIIAMVFMSCQPIKFELNFKSAFYTK